MEIVSLLQLKPKKPAPDSSSLDLRLTVDHETESDEYSLTQIVAEGIKIMNIYGIIWLKKSVKWLKHVLYI